MDNVQAGIKRMSAATCRSITRVLCLLRTAFAAIVVRCGISQSDLVLCDRSQSDFVLCDSDLVICDRSQSDLFLCDRSQIDLVLCDSDLVLCDRSQSTQPLFLFTGIVGFMHFKWFALRFTSVKLARSPAACLQGCSTTCAPNGLLCGVGHASYVSGVLILMCVCECVCVCGVSPASYVSGVLILMWRASCCLCSVSIYLMGVVNLLVTRIPFIRTVNVAQRCHGCFFKLYIRTACEMLLEHHCNLCFFKLYIRTVREMLLEHHCNLCFSKLYIRTVREMLLEHHCNLCFFKLYIRTVREMLLEHHCNLCFFKRYIGTAREMLLEHYCIASILEHATLSLCPSPPLVPPFQIALAHQSCFLLTCYSFLLNCILLMRSILSLHSSLS